MSLKRRRAINIDTAIIDALKVESVRRDLKSHTTLAVAILLGKEEPLPFVDKEASKTLGVSMRESIWLSVRHRSNIESIHHSYAMTCILLGSSPPLTPAEIAKGEELAAKREAERAKEPQPPKRKRKQASSKEVKVEPSPPTPIDEDAEEEEDRKRRQAKLPKGSSVDPPKSPDRNDSGLSNTEEVHFGGIYSL